MKIDDYLFEPCGYSMNGILKNESIDFGLVNIRLFCSIQTKFYSCKLLFFEYTYIFFMYVLILNTVYFVHIGRIYDYSYHSRTGIFICQLREQHPFDFLLRRYSTSFGYFYAWKIYFDYFCEQGKKQTYSYFK